MKTKIDFISAAILDIQATIRAIDVKIAALLVGLLAPVASANRIFAHINHFGAQTPKFLYIGIIFIFLIAWLLALVALVRAISAIDNPAQHIINTANLNGSFYAGGLYDLGLLDVFANRKIVKASKDPASFEALVPNTEQEITKELIFEQLKLAYIRDMKITRLNWGLRFAFLWFFIGLSILLTSKYIF